MAMCVGVVSKVKIVLKSGWGRMEMSTSGVRLCEVLLEISYLTLVIDTRMFYSGRKLKISGLKLRIELNVLILVFIGELSLFVENKRLL